MTPTVTAATASATASTAASAPTGPGERAPANRLGNMSCRPTTEVTHPSNDPARQLVPAFRAALAIPPRCRPGSPQALLRALGIDTTGLARGRDPARLRLEAIADAVVEILPLPAVMPLFAGGGLPDTVERREPMLALALLARRSGPVFLRHRTPGLEGLERGGMITLLLPAPARARILAAVDAPGWPALVLERARHLETTRLEASR